MIVADAVDQQEGVVPGQNEIGYMADDDGVKVAEIKHVFRTHQDGDIHPFLLHDGLHLLNALLDVAAQFRTGAFFF